MFNNCRYTLDETLHNVVYDLTARDMFAYDFLTLVQCTAMIVGWLSALALTDRDIALVGLQTLVTLVNVALNEGNPLKAKARAQVEYTRFIKWAS